MCKFFLGFVFLAILTGQFTECRPTKTNKSNNNSIVDSPNETTIAFDTNCRVEGTSYSVAVRTDVTPKQSIYKRHHRKPTPSVEQLDTIAKQSKRKRGWKEWFRQLVK